MIKRIINISHTFKLCNVYEMLYINLEGNVFMYKNIKYKSIDEQNDIAISILKQNKELMSILLLEVFSKLFGITMIINH